MSVIHDHAEIMATLDAMAECIGREATEGEVSLIGILRGGARVADALQARLEAAGRQVRRGHLDISFYRDDLDAIGPHPEVRPSDLPFDLNERRIWLVDDVLYTGRTIRAALGELFDYGRPAAVRLAVLVDRGGRELPIAPDCAGLRIEAGANESVELVIEGRRWRIETRAAGRRA
ncbi:MAG: bifunctional pyr operon transcriptional regulator/uracil phosphoribosyltransferase PyrR [Mariprofundaceae bacterium]